VGGACSASNQLRLPAGAFGLTAPDEELRQVGHDLRKAYQEAKACGLVSSDERGLTYVLDRLAAAHLKQTLRYMPADLECYRLPTAETLLRVIERLHADITAQFTTLASDLYD
jgi:hypothetical protein